MCVRALALLYRKRRGWRIGTSLSRSPLNLLSISSPKAFGSHARPFSLSMSPPSLAYGIHFYGSTSKVFKLATYRGFRIQNGPPCTMHGIVAPGLPLSYVSLGRREEVMTNRQESAVLVVFSPSGTGDTPASGCSTNTRR